MSIIALNLSQELSEISTQNGVWNTNLSKEIQINEGDEISIKNVFIDTINISSGKVVIPDITIHIENGFYIVDWFNSSKTYLDTSQTTPSYKYFIPGQYQSGTPHTDISIWNSVLFGYAGGATPDWGGISVEFSYIDINGNTLQHSIFVPSENGRVQPSIKIDVNLIVKTGSIKILTNQKTLADLYKTTINAINTTGTSVITGAIFHPIIKKTNINLDKGSYDPQKLCLMINQQLTDLKSSSTNLTNSSFLTTNNQLSAGGNFYYFSSDATQLMTTTDDLLVGASQMELNYNTASQKFEWDYIHMPYYSTTATVGNISVRYENVGGELYSTGSNGGIFFTSLSATIRNTNEQYDFWHGDLGFDLSQLIVNPSAYEIEKVIGTFANVTIPKYEFVVGGNITSGFQGLDNIVPKTAKFYEIDTITAGNFKEDSTDTTYIITANNSLSSTELDSSHYLIEIQALMNNKFINEHITSGIISGIVSRFYNYGSFTSAGSESALTYIHMGPSAYLKSFRVRILNKDMTVPDNIGNRNDIYLQVVKQPQQPQLEAPKKK